MSRGKRAYIYITDRNDESASESSVATFFKHVIGRGGSLRVVSRAASSILVYRWPNYEQQRMQFDRAHGTKLETTLAAILCETLHCGVDVRAFPKWGRATLATAFGNARLASEVHLEFWLPSATNFDNSDAAPNLRPQLTTPTQSQWHPSAGTSQPHRTPSRRERKLTVAVVVPPVTS